MRYIDADIMREILFRGKRTDNGEWVVGYYCPCCFGRFPCRPAIIPKDRMDDGSWEPKEIILETLGQYTGLTTNGKKIFEGDIIKYTRTQWNEPLHKDNGKDIVSLHEVYYDENQGAFKQRHYNGRIIGSGLLSSFSDSRAKENIIEVIGNIYDNPELLKGE